MEKKFCYRCMGNYDGFKTVCPHCGYDENSAYNNMYLAPGTILHDRYLVGILLGFNGEGATYIAYDRVISCKVLLREYMPVNLCTRVQGKPTISVNYNNLAKYKAFMAEYTELNKSLARLRNNTSINPTLDMFAENNTTYTVFEYIEGYKLLDYLKENAGELTWEQVSRLFPPLFTTIGIIHNAGIIHRAISPETIYITAKGEIKLSGFCISSIRTIGAGLDCELFKGYAAPEQYSSSSSSRQGTWTDVYGLSALLYRMLTGCMPTESIERIDNDNLCEPHSLNPNVPKHVSRAIMDGMNISGNNRIQTVTELVTRLFEQAEEEPAPMYTEQPKLDNTRTTIHHTPDSNLNRTGTYTRIHNTQNFNNQQYNNYNSDFNEDFDDDDVKDYEYEKVESNTIDKIKIPIIIGVLLLAVLMILGVTLYNVIFPEGTGNDEEIPGSYASMNDNIIEADSEPTEAQTTENLDGVIPDLIGKFFEITQTKYESFIVLEPEYEFNEEYEDGQIFWQEFEPRTEFKTGSVMKVKVSKGKSTVEIPDYSNCTHDEYESRLYEAQIKNYIFIEDNYANVEPGAIIKLEVNGNTVNAGDKLDNSKNQQLIIYYKSKTATTTTTTTTTTETTTTTTTTTVPETTEYIETYPPETYPSEEETLPDNNYEGDYVEDPALPPEDEYYE